jgi:peptide/nickel transport system permease protein
MLALLARRVVFLVAVLFGITLLTFIFAHVLPTDPARLLAGPHASIAQYEAIRHRFGLDQPLLKQYAIYLGNLAHGDFGSSGLSQRAVGDDLVQFLPATIELSITALLIAISLGMLLGITAAYWRNTWLDSLVSVLALSGLAMPAFWLGLLAQWLFYSVLGWFPSGGRLDIGLRPPPRHSGLYTLDSLLAGRFDLLGNALWHLVLPAVVLGCGSIGVIARMIRGTLIESLAQDYVRTARAKGLTRFRVVMRHALRNSLLPTITVVGLQCGYLLSGAILVETVFSWPGIGLYATQSILAADYQPIVGVTLVIALIYVLVNTVVDLTYAATDPRVRYS